MTKNFNFRPKPSDYQLGMNFYPNLNNPPQGSKSVVAKKEETKELFLPSAEAHKQMMALVSTLKQKDDMIYVVAMKVGWLKLCKFCSAITEKT